MKQNHSSRFSALFHPLFGLFLGVLAAPALAALTDNGDGTVTDSATGLTWDRCAWGRTWDSGTVACDAGGLETFSWSDALKTAVAANSANHRGHRDWRVPSKNELESLVDIQATVTPAIPAVFPWPYPGAEFWSSTTYLPTPASAWRIDFQDGGAAAGDKGSLWRVRLVRGGHPAAAFDALDVTAPVLSNVGVSGTTQTATSLAATSNEAATGFWVVVGRDAAAPSAAQVKAGADYGAVTVKARGSSAMAAGLANNFAVAGLSAGTAYDLYLVAQDASLNISGVQKVQFTTLANAYAIAVTAGTGGTAHCSPNPVAHGGSSSCSATPNAGYAFANWSGDCAGASCVLTNVISSKSVTANFTAGSSYAITVSATPVAGGSVVCTPSTVSSGGDASCAISANAGYTLTDLTDNGLSVIGSVSNGTYVIHNVTAAHTLVATFSAQVPLFGPWAIWGLCAALAGLGAGILRRRND